MAVGALSKLLQGLKREPHDYRASLETFPALSVDRITTELSLTRAGLERGAKDQPPSDANEPDHIESQIIERIETAKKSAHATLLDQSNLYAERLTSLDFEGRFSIIRQAAPAALSELRAAAAIGRDEIHWLRRDLKDRENEKEHFRRTNKIFRAPRLSSTGGSILKVGLLAVFVLIELVVNGAFLAKSNELGLLGGIIEAFTFAVLNVGGAVLITWAGIRQINRRAAIWKIIGFLSIITFLVFTTCLNLALAHYREVSGTLVDDAGTQVLVRLLNHPLALTDIKSVLFFFIGIAFSIAALIDAWFLTDPYPGYAGVEDRLIKSHSKYHETKEGRIAQLDEIRSDTIEALEEANKDLAIRRSEYDSIIENRARIYSLFANHQEQLERAGQALLTIYRDANRGARQTTPPKRWKQAFRLDRIEEALAQPGSARDDLRKSIADAQADLVAHVKQVNTEFDLLVAMFHQIDDLVQESTHGVPVREAA